MVTLRPGTPQDAARVADIWHEGWHPAHDGHVPDGLAARRTLAAFHERAPLRVADTTVAEVDGQVAGFIMVAGDELEQIYVAIDHHGRGVASALIADGERQIAAQGYDVAWLAVAIGNMRARAFYEKQGWRNVGDLPYEVVALGETFVSPCRRYEKTLS